MNTKCCCLFCILSLANAFCPLYTEHMKYPFFTDLPFRYASRTWPILRNMNSFRHTTELPLVRNEIRNSELNMVRTGIVNDGHDESSTLRKLLREALDGMEDKRLNVGHLRPERRKEISEYAKNLATIPSPIQPSSLARGGLLVGRWKLAITSSLSWFQEMWPSQKVFVEIRDGGNTGRLQYIVDFATPKLLLRSLRCDARFLHSGAVLNFVCRRIFADVAGREIPLFFLPARAFGGSMLTSYFDGELWVVNGGGAVYRYAGDAEIAQADEDQASCRPARRCRARGPIEAWRPARPACPAAEAARGEAGAGGVSGVSI